MALGKTFGIDLGTTYSCIAYVDDYGQPVVLQNSEGELTTPSVVHFESADNIVVGRAAKNAARVDSERVVSFVKRSMGDPTYSFSVDGKTYTAQEVSALILRKVVQDAEALLGEEVRDVVITCPAYFGLAEVEATRDAGLLAGLNVLGVVREPVAAALHYGVAHGGGQETVLIYDLGGGTFDVTMIAIDAERIEVLFTGGDHQLGGKDWDDRIMAYYADEFARAHPEASNPLTDNDVAQDLAISAEEAKKMLSVKEKDIRLVQHAGHRQRVELTPDKLEELTADLLDRTVTLTEDLLRDAAQHGRPTRLLLVGGSSKAPVIARRLRDALGLEPQLFEPDHAVAKGAAVYASRLGTTSAVNEVLRQLLNLPADSPIQSNTVDPRVLAEAETIVAQKFGVTTETVRVANSVDKIVMVSSKAFGMKVQDLQTDEFFIDHLIVGNTALPCETKGRYGTVVHDQRVIEIDIYEQAGHVASREPAENMLIVQGTIGPLPSGLPAGSPIEVTFALSPEGMLRIHGRELTSNRTVDLQATVSGVMGEAERKEKSRALAALTVS